MSCTSASACTAVGDYETATSPDLTLAEHWDGASWTIQPTPNPAGATGMGLSGVSCSSASACTAVSFFFANTVEVWDGTSWTVPAIPGPTNSDLSGVSCVAAGACTAVGSYSSTSGTSLTLAVSTS